VQKRVRSKAVKKKKLKDVPPKHERLSHQAVKAIVRAAKVVKTFIIRKDMRKLKELSDSSERSVTLKDHIANIKGIPLDSLEAYAKNAIHGSAFDVNLHTDEIFKHKTMKSEIDSWKSRIEMSKIKRSKKSDSASSSSKSGQAKSAVVRPLALNKKERTTALFVSSLASDSESEDDSSAQKSVSKKRPQNNRQNSNARSSGGRKPQRRQKLRPDLNSYMPISQRSSSTSNSGWPPKEHVSRQQVQSGAQKPPQIFEYSRKFDNNANHTTKQTNSSAEKSIHPSWAAKIKQKNKLEGAISFANVPQGKKIRFTE